MAMEVADFDLRSGVVLKRHVERRRAAGDAENQQSQNAPQTRHRRLTVKLRGRPAEPNRRRKRTISSSARGAKQTTPHGPLQRLLGGGCMSLLNRRHLKYRVRMIVGNMGMHELTS